MIVPERVFWTEDRERLVFEDDPAARFLAFPKGEDVGDPAASEIGLDKLVATRQAKRIKQGASR